MRRRLAALVLAALVAVACAVAWGSARGPAPGRAERVREIAASLRCPDCQGLSAAESPSTFAEAMRLEIGRRVDRGESPRRVQEYFVRRYGEGVLTSPPSSGHWLALWALPAVVLAVGCGVALAVPWPRRRTPGPRPRGPGGRRELAGVLALGVASCCCGALAVALARDEDVPPAAVSASSGREDVGELLALGRELDARGESEQALRQYGRAVRLRPGDAASLRLLGLALLRTGRPREAVAALRPMAARAPDDADLLLVLGAAEMAVEPPAGRRTLRRFLRVAPPGHPALVPVRRLLGEGSTP
ncbi:cytochrome c-type biogenesis protein CcmH [Sphaerisporangium fuscum]|uniref:cytochrome c-type biogenesis protein CcmH n=1 Tax=Sphaerisporangium fuscum TaxID=2835868 RepID=UPI001BDCC418|nr:cytochrome c-type biogenesis protein CcmH [Sphaerisporangium fuscum]